MKIKNIASIFCVLSLALTMTACSSSNNMQNITTSGDFTSGTGALTDNYLDQKKESDLMKGRVIFNNNGTKYYGNGKTVFRITDADTFEPVKIYDEQKLSDTSIPKTLKDYYDKTGEQYDPKYSLDDLFYSDSQMTHCGNDYYGLQMDVPKFYHLWFINNGVVNMEELYTLRNMQSLVKKTSFLGDLENNKLECLLFSLTYPQDGGDGYIYASLRLDRISYSEYPNLESKLVRLAKDGSGYEFVNDISASSFTINDGWLYYYDSGYNTDENNRSRFDSTRRGIYKMKLNGSEKTKLKDYFTTNRNVNYFNAVAKMTVMDNQLYYVSMDGTDYYLYTLDLNSGISKKISEEVCNCYYVDKMSNRIFYAGVNNDSGLNFIRIIDISNFTETELKTDHELYKFDFYSNIQIDDDYLYIRSAAYKSIQYVMDEVTITKKDGSKVTINEPEYQLYTNQRCGERVNINTGNVEYLYYYQKGRGGDDGISIWFEITEPRKVEWKSAEKVNKTLTEIKEKYELAEDE